MLLTQIGNQKSKIYDSLYKLKQREVNQSGSCLCKGNCSINHQKYRWTPHISDMLINKLKKSISPDDIRYDFVNFKCDNCDVEFPRKELLGKHNKFEHASQSRYLCEQCDRRFQNDVSVTNHKGVHQDRSHKFKCMPCDKGFPSEVNLITHIDMSHCTKQGELEKSE